MAKKKYYAVKVGKAPGIYMTWAECEKQVKGFPGAQFKSFPAEEEALTYMAGQVPVELGESTEETNARVKGEIQDLQSHQAIAFVDGSYCHDMLPKPKYSYGVVFLTSEGMETLSGAGDREDYVDARNVAGEIMGVEAAINKAIEEGKGEIKVFYDYEGIRKWALKEWKANAKISKDYVEFFGEKSGEIKVSFEHVKAHTGIEYNEMVDRLAKAALER